MIFANIDPYKKDWLFVYEQKNYWQISPLGDGNCGLYAFTCGLIDSIITDKLTIAPKKFNDFISCIQETPSIYPKMLDLNENIESDISKFLEWIYQPNLTFAEFKSFFINYPLTHDSIIALNLICSQALREIGIISYLEEIGMLGKPLLKEDEKLLENHQWVGQEILTSLANYFDIDVKLIAKHYPSKTDLIGYYFHQSLPEDVTPSFALLLENNHWYYLIPEENKRGLTTIFPSENRDIEDKKNQPKKTRRISRELLHSNKALIQEIVTDYTHFAKNTFHLFSEKLKQIFASLKEIFSNEADQTKEFRQATKQAKTVAQHSTQIINSWRETWGTSHQLDRHLSDLGLHELEKTLIKNSLITDESDDAAIAAILQNAEIADFLSRHYTSLKRPNPSIPVSKSDSHITNHNRYITAHDLRNVVPCISVSS